MKKQLSKWLAVVVIAAGVPLSAQSGADPGWPRSFSNGTADLTVYHPQIDGWSEFKTLRGRVAIALRTSPQGEAVYGTLRFEAETLVDADQKLVLMRNIRAQDMRFPSAPDGGSPQWAELVRSLMPSNAMVVSLDRILAYVRAAEVPKQEARVLNDPPPILFSDQAAVLVMLDGDPVHVDVENTRLRRVVNTNWDLYQDSQTNFYYLRNGRVWQMASSWNAQFAPVSELPADFARLPQPADAPVKTSATASMARAMPRVFVVNHPAELIVVRGVPALEPITGTALAFITNTDSDLFYHSVTHTYYFLTSGRWFQSAVLSGGWQYASQNLPMDFRAIPATHVKAHVLAAVPGTREAEDAILLAAIPRTAEVNRQAAKADVQYVGAPQFEAIRGTSISYAKNTPNDVLRIGDLYYLCFQAVWFVSRMPTGPWVAADKVPAEIYTIPESSPKYNVTYVRIYDSTPTTIVVGYTPGYYGAYVAGGVVVWGTGYYYPRYVAVGVAAVPVYWAAPYYTYGAGAWYNPASGVYARGAVAYGPYGGYAAGAAYNPRTGTYAQGAGAWGPAGGVAAGRTYNPATGISSAGYQAANPYASWGQGVVSNGSNWARGGYQSTARGTVAAGQTSQGGAGVAFNGVNGNSGYVGHNASGDIYAGANGNVYKRENGQWYQNQSGSWNAMERGQVNAQAQQAAARNRGSFNAQRSEMSRRANFPAGGQRPQVTGRRR